MLIEKLMIKNYRKFEKLSVEFNDDNLIVLAGANNTGKTSLVLLLRSLFNNTKMVRDVDISIEVRNKYIKELTEYIESKSPSDANKFVELLLEYMSKKDKNIEEEFISNKVLNYPIKAQLIISYDVDEPIGIFADYLMDLDENNRQLYFEYSVGVNNGALRNGLNEIKENLFKKYNEILNAVGNKAEKINLFERAFFKELNNYLENKYYYCDQNFKLRNEIPGKDFKSLINFKYISASRKLDDEEVKDKSITNSVIDINDPLTDHSDWKAEFDDLRKAIKKAFDDNQIEQKLESSTSKELDIIKKSLDSVAENEIDGMEAMLLLEDKIILDLIKSAISINYTYQTDNGKIVLGEESQGLGVSNLIYITLEIQKFIRKAKTSKDKVNIFIIEEPENHMHVQMQKIFISYLMDIFSKDTLVQSMVTTHSTEIVKECKLDYIKVIRPSSVFKNYLVDLKEFVLKHSEDRNFYETLFKLNFSNIIFADYAILFEGDTERMYLESLLTRSGKYPVLARKYIAYCQVGGAHAKKYFPLIEELRVKTCIFTDIDYSRREDKELGDDRNKALKTKSTNATLNCVVKKTDKDDESILVSDILERISDNQEFNKNEDYRIFTQNIKDGYARTLEDTLLREYINKNVKNLKLRSKINNVFQKIDKKNWKKIRQQSKFVFSLPNPQKASIRYVTDKISKSDFMYSVIMNDLHTKSIPNYINEGLSWLQKQ